MTKKAKNGNLERGNKVRIMSWNNICKSFEVEEKYNDNIQVETYINTEKYGYDQ